MEVGGLPLHPLVVHAAVVFTPIAALVALAYVGLGRWRDRLRWPMVAITLVATASVGVAFLSGNALLERMPQLRDDPLVGTHEARAQLLWWLTLGLAAVVAVTAWLHPRQGTPRLLSRGLLGLAAVAVLVQVVLTGDAGSRAVWQSVLG